MLPGQQRHDGIRQIVGRDLRQRGLVGQQRSEPIGGRGGERRIGQIGPLAAFGPAQKHHPIAPLQQRLAPRQPVEAERQNAVGEHLRGLRPRRDRDLLLDQRDGAEPAEAAPRKLALAASNTISSPLSIRSAKCVSISPR